MNRYLHAVRSPVRRPGAERYLLITLLSFALSVSLTRLFLEVTGYPRLGGESLHIAHVLWGGLLLFVAAALPLLIANRWVYQAAALLAGVGIGLFIDEIGKFITANNNYFYPPAAPMIYAFFLICVLIYLQLKRPSLSDPRSELYFVLEMLEDVLDHDLDKKEQAEINRRLRHVAGQIEEPELARLAEALLNYCMSDDICMAPPTPQRVLDIERRLKDLEKRYISRSRYHSLLAVALGLLGVYSIFVSIWAVKLAMGAALSGGAAAITGTAPEGLPNTPLLLFTLENGRFIINYWFLILQFFRGTLGAILILNGIYILIGRERQGLRGAYFSLLVYLTMVDLLLFYYYQFSTILSAIIQFALLLAVLYYQERYLGTSETRTLPTAAPSG